MVILFDLRHKVYILYQFVKLFQCKMYKRTQGHQTHAALCKIYSVREQNEQKRQFTVSRLSIVFGVTKSRFRDGASVLQNALRSHSLTAIPTASSLHALSITNVTLTLSSLKPSASIPPPIQTFPESASDLHPLDLTSYFQSFQHHHLQLSVLIHPQYHKPNYLVMLTPSLPISTVAYLCTAQCNDTRRCLIYTFHVLTLKSQPMPDRFTSVCDQCWTGLLLCVTNAGQVHVCV